jgi:perosamine synthetase
LTFSDQQLELRIRTLRGQGMDPERRYYFPVTGYNFRMTNVQAAMLCAQLERHEVILAQRRRVFADYQQCLADIPGVSFQPRAAWAEPAPWLFSILVDEKAFGRSRDELAALLAVDGIETRPFFVPLHQLPPFRSESRVRKDILPETEILSHGGMNLPTYNLLGVNEIAYIADRIRAHCRAKHG